MNKKAIAETIETLIRKPLKIARCFIGFDGFTDEISSAVESRRDADHFTPFPTIQSFGQRILDSAGTSCNVELVLKQIKIGGNAPILTNALLEGGHKIVFVGAIGKPGEIEPLFAQMAKRCEKVFALAPSGHSDAIEFSDGKVILGKLHSLTDITWDNLLKQLDHETLTKTLNESDLFVSANWTMLPHLTDIWKKILTEIAPKLTKRSAAAFMFVDLADPAKRSDADLLDAVQTLTKLNTYFRVVLGLNLAEAKRIGKILEFYSSENVSDLAKDIWQKLHLDRVIIHNSKFAFCAEKDNVCSVETYYTDNPTITTGAGDNFNAGYCNGLLLGLSSEESLLAAVATAGFYVREGRSPSMKELTNFIGRF